jgi:hypothetical protein
MLDFGFDYFMFLSYVVKAGTIAKISAPTCEPLSRKSAGFCWKDNLTGLVRIQDCLNYPNFLSKL